MAKIVVDSGCDLTQEMKDQKGIAIDVAPLTLQLGEQLFIDDDQLDVTTYIEKMAASPHVPKTAAPSPERYLEKFKSEGSIFAVTLSSKLSGSYNSAITAKDMYLEEMGQKFIHIFDSLSASVGEMLVALKINDCIKQNKSDQETVTHVTQFIQNMNTYFILERYDTIVKNGRMNAYVAKIASMMSFKPICGAKEGNMVFLDKARGFNKAIHKLMDLMQKDGQDFENRILGISHVKALEKAQAIKALAASRFNFKDIVIVEATGLCATYADREGVIIAF